LALGSASKNANLALEKVGLLHKFNAIVDANHVVNGKPNPETFLKAAEMLQIAPENCIVFEDSASGIKAAVDGKMFAVGIGTQNDLPLANYCIPNLGAFDFNTL
jgi:beta-phosphoglucomutase